MVHLSSRVVVSDILTLTTSGPPICLVPLRSVASYFEFPDSAPARGHRFRMRFRYPFPLPSESSRPYHVHLNMEVRQCLVWYRATCHGGFDKLRSDIAFC